MKKHVLTWKRAVLSALCIVAALAIMALAAGFTYTPVQKDMEVPGKPGGTPFYAGAAGSNYFRIPALTTLQDGTVVAAIDARFGGTHDSPNNLDTVVSSSKDGGTSWSDALLANHFVDFTDADDLLSQRTVTNKRSASSIDPALLEDRTIHENGRLFLLTDMFPGGYGSPQAEAGSGFVEIDGKKYLRLQKDGEDTFDYTVRENGVIYDKNNSPTSYSINGELELLENGKPLMVTQRKAKYWFTMVTVRDTDKEVPMNIMYENALFHPVGTSYLVLQSSDDQGATWSDPILLNAQIKTDDMRFLGVGPGQGIQVQTGEYQGRLIFPVYTIREDSSRQACTVIYSDDHGITWQLGKGPDFDGDVQMMSESQVVEMPDGSLQCFARTSKSRVAAAISTDGGATWSKGSLVEELPLTGGSGCQVSAIRYDGLIDGKPAVLVSAPAADGRKHGVIHIGLIEGDKAPYEIDWKYSYDSTGADTYFAYSCLTQLPSGDIGILYEETNVANAINAIKYKTYTIAQLTGTES